VLSVISAFAQADLDPWQETFALAKMSREKATARLSLTIEKLPGGPKLDRPIAAIAGDLVALLPHANEMSSALPRGFNSVEFTKDSKMRWGMGAMLLLLVVAVLLSLHMGQTPLRGGSEAVGLQDSSKTAPQPPAR
jgi:hypothetical protein